MNACINILHERQYHSANSIAQLLLYIFPLYNMESCECNILKSPR